MSLPPIALPGQPLGPISSYATGPGTHLPSSTIYSPNPPRPSTLIRASILGPTLTTPSKKGLPTISISRRDVRDQQLTLKSASLLPKEGDIILGRVMRINIREARVQILIINDVPVMEEFIGVIRYRSDSFLRRY